jgi:hypothetical protein
MSITSAAAFFDKAVADKTIQDRVTAAAAGKDDPQEKADAVAKLGKSMGFDFTASEAIQLRATARKVLIDRGETEDELDDLDLQAVTGGLSTDQKSLISQMVGLAAGNIPGMPAGSGMFMGAGAQQGTQAALDGGGFSGFVTGFAQGVGDAGQKVGNAINTIFSGW